MITRPETCHICYCETPMRYLWNMYHRYKKSLGGLGRFAWSPISAYLRMWDRASADRVDFFIANSRNVARRIWKYYRREAAVVHCPVDWERFQIGSDEGFYLYVGELSEYKGIRSAVEAFIGSDRKLVVVGDGPLMREMRRRATPNIEFVGWMGPDEVAAYYANCRAFVFPGEEDFGITPLEAMASGKPVIALGKGGALETVVHERTGFLFPEEGPAGLRAGVERIEAGDWDAEAIREYAERFSKDNTRNRLASAVAQFQEMHSDQIAQAGSLIEI